MDKKIFINFLVGALGGFIAAMSVIGYRLPASIVSSPKFQNELKSEITENSQKTISNSSILPDFWQSMVSDASLTTVAVESFKDNKIIRQGTGIIASSDGLIVTTTDVATVADAYQILNADKISRAQVVQRDYSKNLALLKINASDLSASDFSGSGSYAAGSDIIITGKIVNLSKAFDFSQRALVSYVSDNGINLDTTANFYLSGAKAMNSTGNTIGMTSIRYGKVNLIDAKSVDDFVKNYLAKNNSQ